MKLNHLRNASLLALSVALASCGQQQAALSTTSTQSGSASLQAQNLNLPAAVTQSETPELWFVEFSEKPTSKGGNSAALGQQKKLFRQQAAADQREDQFAVGAEAPAMRMLVARAFSM